MQVRRSFFANPCFRPLQSLCGTSVFGSRGSAAITQAALLALIIGLGLTPVAGAQAAAGTVAVGDFPYAIVVNPVTNKVYVANENSNTVTVIDGATNATSTVSVGNTPQAIAVNPVTNKVYVVNSLSGTVTVIDGATNATSTVSVGNTPQAIAVNPVTNKVYVVNSLSGTVTVIDGLTNATSTVTVGNEPIAIAVNPVTNQIYVANQNDNTVTAIDGATNATSTVSVGSVPVAIAVNPVTDKVYVANVNDDTVTVIDGATNATSTLSVGIAPLGIGVNPVTNQVYVANGGGTVTVIDGATNATSTVHTGNAPATIAVNPVTNQIYVANHFVSVVTVIDGATNATSTVNAGHAPAAIVVNPVTNKVYAANENSNTVTVIDGARNATTPLTVGSGGQAIAVNPATNQIYVAEISGNTVEAIDGASNATSTVTVGSEPLAISVNPVTNRVYVANQSDNTVTAIDGATNVTTTLTVGIGPLAIAVNPATNKVYVVNRSDGTVTVIDGATNATSTVTVGSAPIAIAVNPVTNQVYVANQSGGTVTVIDGATNATSTVMVSGSPVAITVNPVTNKIYVANYTSDSVTVIDGATAASTVSVGFAPDAVAVNPVTNKIYVATGSSPGVVIDVDGSQPAPLAVTAAGVGDPLTVSGTSIFTTVNSTPAFTATVTSDFTSFPVYSGLSAANPAPESLFYWVDDGSMTSWNQAIVTSFPFQNPAEYSITLPQQSLGVHMLYLFADYGDEGEGISSSAGIGSSPVISNLQAVSYAILPASTTTTLTADVNPQSVGGTVNFTATVTPGSGRTAAPTGSVYFYDGSTLLGQATLTPNGGGYAATYAWAATDGANAIKAVYTGDGNYSASTATLTETVDGAPAAINIVAGNSQTSAVGTAFTYALEVRVVDADNIPLPNIAVTFSGTGLSFSSNGVAVTNANGEASVAATPAASGTLNASVSVSGLSAAALFTETATGSGPQTPAIAWPAPAPIVHGTALSATQLSATASYNGTNVPGTFTYNPASGTVPNVGAQTLSVTFTPNDLTIYTTATATVTLQVSQAMPSITWAAPAAIIYGTALGSAQLDASANVAGGFSYSPSAGMVLAAGTQTLSVTFTPSDTTNYAIATATVAIAVNQATPSLNWTAPAGIVYGAPLSARQLHATANVPGQFIYTPAAGTVLGAGTQTLSVSFTPDDTIDYTPASATVQIAVSEATPVITWTAPSAIQYGTALGSTQLNATANVAGSFSYTPAAGTVLSAGPQTLGVSFTPTDTTDYVSPVTATAPIVVTKATPVISWATPASIPYGTALSGTQLNATSPVSGTFSYTPAAGTTPGAGLQTLGVTFTPNDTTDYGTATATVTLAVTSAAPAINWAAPTAITYGTPLGSAQLDASANVAGVFSYSPGLGAILPAGTQTLTAVFTPSNSTGYSSTTATTTIVVNQATPVITWETPANINAGTPLSAAQLNATASVAGSFTYSPAAGTVLPTGTTTLTTTFTPSDTTDYMSPVTATVQLTVAPALAADFSVSASPAQQAITAGNSAAYVITVAPLNSAFNSAVTLSVSGLQAGFTASFSPSSITPGTAATNTTMTLTTPSIGAANRRPLLPVGGDMGVLAAMLAGLGLMRARKASLRLLVALIALFSLGAAAALTGCGGSSSSSSYQNYTVTVTATAGSVSHTTEVILSVK